MLEAASLETAVDSLEAAVELPEPQAARLRAMTAATATEMVRFFIKILLPYSIRSMFVWVLDSCPDFPGRSIIVLRHRAGNRP